MMKELMMEMAMALAVGMVVFVLTVIVVKAYDPKCELNPGSWMCPGQSATRMPAKGAGQ